KQIAQMFEVRIAAHCPRRRKRVELAGPRPNLDDGLVHPPPEIAPYGVTCDLELVCDPFGAPSGLVQLANLANHHGVDHRHLRLRWCHARRLRPQCFPPFSIPERRGSVLDSDGGHYCDRPTAGAGSTMSLR